MRCNIARGAVALLLAAWLGVLFVGGPSAFAVGADESSELALEENKKGGANADSDEDVRSEPKPLDAADNFVNEGQVSDSSFLYEAAIADLAGADSYYDNQTVKVTGEAVGEAIYANGSHSWVTLTDVESDASVTVYMENAELDKIDTFGMYGKIGTTLHVQGVYHLTCPEHDGESDVHASAVTVAAIGATQEESFKPAAFLPGLLLVGGGAFLMVVFLRRRERSR